MPKLTTNDLLNPAPTPHQLRKNNPKHSVINHFSFEQSETDRLSYLLEDSPLQGYHLHVFNVQRVFGLRASEVLQICNSNRLPNGLIVIPGKKQSNTRFIFYPQIDSLFDVSRPNRKFYIFPISYKAYYSQLKKNGISFTRSGVGRNKIVSHLFRKTLFDSLHKQHDLDLETVKQFSGHKSMEGLLYYIGSNSLKKGK